MSVFAPKTTPLYRLIATHLETARLPRLRHPRARLSAPSVFHVSQGNARGVFVQAAKRLPIVQRAPHVQQGRTSHGPSRLGSSRPSVGV